ncbi:Uncharacterised protein [Bordetella ansorpii]|uniref:Uncharacterized protein n=1 Tax=Bordetella ansorpii TaxID=288768 RepID=A0A157SW57_9BORD|nr:hypothetical protein [Bordetella ansorpii]SAI74574.1 Uncharacterised protein [Bordetella ansorpii]
MTALTSDRSTPYRQGEQVSDPLAAGAVIYAGGMYALDGDGNAVRATAAGNAVRAVAQVRAVQADGDERVDGSRGVWRFGNAAGAAELTRADIGSVAYVVDDQTVGKTGTAVAGLVFDIEGDEVWIDIGAASVVVNASAGAAA